MATATTLALREICPQPTVIPGTECSLKIADINGRKVVVGRKTCMPYIGASRDRSLPGKARIRARKAARGTQR